MDDRGDTPQSEVAQPLRLIAMDGEDLAVVSTHLQDALVRVGDIAYLPEARRFALLGDRFDWCAAGCGRMERRRTGLHFDGVVRAMRHGFAQNKETTLNLLSLSFTETDAPAGVVTLTFSGGAAIRLEVECLDAQMRDMGPRWSVSCKPGHDLPSAAAEF